MLDGKEVLTEQEFLLRADFATLGQVQANLLVNADLSLIQPVSLVKVSQLLNVAVSLVVGALGPALGARGLLLLFLLFESCLLFQSISNELLHSC